LIQRPLRTLDISGLGGGMRFTECRSSLRMKSV